MRGGTEVNLSADLNFEGKVYCRTNKLDMLHDFALAINSTHNLQEILTNSVNKICEIMDGEECYISFCDQPDYEEKLGKVQKLQQKGKIAIVSAPIIVKGNKIGFLAVQGKKRQQYDVKDAEFLAMLGNHLGVAIENADLMTDLYKAAVLDPLTEAYNYRYFRDELISSFQSSKALPNTLVLIDLNDFKPINDNYGHLVGDKILKETVRILKENVRANDTVARNGGDEFALILPGADSEETAKIMGRIQSAFERFHYNHLGEQVTVSLAWGAVTSYGKVTDADSLIRLADAKMYDMKRCRKKPRKY